MAEKDAGKKENKKVLMTPYDKEIFCEVLGDIYARAYWIVKIRREAFSLSCDLMKKIMNYLMLKKKSENSERSLMRKKTEIKQSYLDKLQRLCRKIYEELKELKMPVNYPALVTFKDLPRTLGQCQRVNDETKEFRIFIALRLKDDPEALREVMAHELLHTATRCRGHKPEWLVYAYIAEWRNHYGLFGAVHSSRRNRYKFQCGMCGSYYRTEEIPKGWIRCPVCRKAMNSVKRIDYSCEKGPDRLPEKYRKLTTEFLQKGVMPV